VLVVCLMLAPQASASEPSGTQPSGTQPEPLTVYYHGAPCSVSKYNTHFTGKNRIYFHSSSAHLWKLNYTKYNFGPPDSQSTHNNQNLRFFGGSHYFSKNSADSLVRNGHWYVGMGLAGNNVYGQKGKSYATFTDIFDVPSLDDPNCKNTTVQF
jgi:hypothetical protein